MNIDGASKSSTLLSGCGGVYRDHNSTFMGAFVLHIGPQATLVAELRACIQAVTIIVEKHWSKLWIETDSKLVLQAFHIKSIVP